jgi:V/A-type H+-transporting ATPase subunit B
MSLAVNIPLFEALDRCWDILAECFTPVEVPIRRSILENHWPKVIAGDDQQESAETEEATA